jgi:transposase
MRVGQKNGRVRIWARRGTRPRQFSDQRYQNAYVFGAVCPARDIGAALILPRVNTEGMQKHLEEISRQVAPGAHAVVIMDGAGWHTTKKLDIPSNLTPIKLPPYCPELNSQENIWQFMRKNYLSSLLFSGYDAIVEACSSAWNKVTDEVGRIRSIATRKWANIGAAF